MKEAQTCDYLCCDDKAKKGCLYVSGFVPGFFTVLTQESAKYDIAFQQVQNLNLGAS